jgi:hypothetical protein
MVELYLHSPIRLYIVVLRYLKTRSLRVFYPERVWDDNIKIVLLLGREACGSE